MPVLQPTPAGPGSVGQRAARGNTEIIAGNSVWYGLEVVITIISTLATSIVIARAIGPDKLGYFSYIMWLANISAAIGSFGIPATTRKYMAEYFGLGQPGVSRAIYQATLRSQSILAGLITGVGLILVFTLSDRQYWWSSAFLVASVLPGMLTAIPAQANEAAENMKANVPSSLLGSLVYVACVAISIGFGWGLPGVAIGLFLGRVSEVALRLLLARKWIATLPISTVPDSLRVRMRTFLGLSTVLMLLQVIVWDRSDIVLLKTFSGSIREITFFSIAFNLTEKALRFPSAFGGAIGATVLAQFGRNQDMLRVLVAKAARYLFLCGLPVLMGLAVLSGPLVRTFYGPQYLPVIPVLCYAALFAIPKTMLLPAQQLLQASEEQRFLVIWICLCGAVNIGLDLLLIPEIRSPWRYRGKRRRASARRGWNVGSCSSGFSNSGTLA